MSKTPEVDAEIARNKARDRRAKAGIAQEEQKWESKFQRIQKEDDAARALKSDLDYAGRIEKGTQYKPSNDIERQRKR